MPSSISERTKLAIDRALPPFSESLELSESFSYFSSAFFIFYIGIAIFGIATGFLGLATAFLGIQSLLISFFFEEPKKFLIEDKKPFSDYLLSHDSLILQGAYS